LVTTVSPSARACASYQHVERSDGAAETLDMSADLPEMRSGLWWKWKHVKARGKLRNGLEILNTPRGFFGTEMEFRKRDARNAEPFGETVESLAQWVDSS
jgi:hypothetical protein